MTSPLIFSFTEHMDNTMVRPQVTVKLGAMQWGDPLDDNSYVNDFYRYHDTFHLGLYALTGWSPVTAHFLRQSDQCPTHLPPPSRQGEMLEECLSIIAFMEAKDRNFFAVDPPSMRLTRLMTDMTRNIALCNNINWPDTLTQIYQVHHQLAEHGGGFVQVNAIERLFQYSL